MYSSDSSDLARRVVGGLVALALTLLLSSVSSAQEQAVRFVVDQETSLAWWQIDPHMDHLWATTCPEDPAWQPGGGFSSAFSSMVRRDREPDDYRGNAAVNSPHIPIYPREEIHPVCAPAVEGTVSVADTTGWTGVSATVALDPEQLVTGDSRRDGFMARILETKRYPTIRFTVDSLVDVQPGDTLRARAIGTLDLHGVTSPIKADVKAWDRGNGLRVRGSFGFPANDLIDTYGMSKWKLGLGVSSNIWKMVHMGIDVILRPEDTEEVGRLPQENRPM